MKKLLLLLAGTGVTVGCFYWSMQGVKVEEFQESFRGANYWTLPAIFLLLFVFYWLKAVRWSWMLQPIRKLGARQLFSPVMIGFAANNVLPAHLGEFVRVFLVGRRHSVPAATVLSTVVLERVFDVMAIVSLFAVSLPFADELPPEYSKVVMYLATAAAAFVVFASVFLLWTEASNRLFSVAMRFVPFVGEGMKGRLVSMMESAGEGLNALRSVHTILALVLNSLVQWILNGLIAYLALRAFHIPVAPADGLILTAVLAVAVMIPSTPGYFGLIQGAFKMSILALGIDAGESRVFAASMYYHMSMYVPVTLTGMFFLSNEGLRLRDLGRVAKDSKQPAAVRSEVPATAEENGKDSEQNRPAGPGR